jgi:GNAT superfamily N-acetyltransferase
MPKVAAGPLLGPGETVTTKRLRLSRAAPGDISSLAWVKDALAPDWTLEDLMPHVHSGRTALVWRSQKPIGLAVALKGVPASGCATIAFIGVDPAERFRGLGGEAALALERLLRERHGVETVLAPIPEQRGLAVYFWLRLGYRPLLRSEAPWPVAGLDGKPFRGIWMARSRP